MRTGKIAKEKKKYIYIIYKKRTKEKPVIEPNHTIRNGRSRCSFLFVFIVINNSNNNSQNVAIKEFTNERKPDRLSKLMWAGTSLLFILYY